MVIGLAAQDTAENAVRKLGMDKLKLLAPVRHGDTLYAYSEVLDKADHDEGGVVTFRQLRRQPGRQAWCSRANAPS